MQLRHQKSKDCGKILPDIGKIVLIADGNNAKSMWHLGRNMDVIKKGMALYKDIKFKTTKDTPSRARYD